MRCLVGSVTRRGRDAVTVKTFDLYFVHVTTKCSTFSCIRYLYTCALILFTRRAATAHLDPRGSCSASGAVVRGLGRVHERRVAVGGDGPASPSRLTHSAVGAVARH